MSAGNLLQCYNRGCGKSFDPDNNPEDACCHHPGMPFFHDAYKGWSCCNRKCTDFTEFLNMKGCSHSKHSNIKPPEPEKPAAKVVIECDPVEVKPIIRPEIKRPTIDTPMTTMQPEVSPSVKTIELNVIETNPKSDDGSIIVGTACKNSGCTGTYQGPKSDNEQCVYHSGSPIFHEGLKYWSCCQKKTTDFTAFLNQAGCQVGKHLWKKNETGDQLVECRWDWHQTPSYVVVAIYAKQYCPKSSTVQLNPIRLLANLVFPQQSFATFPLDVELQGIIDVKSSKVSMYGTKVEIQLKKAKAGTWSKLEIPKVAAEKIAQPVDKLAPKIEAVDLSDLS